MASTAYITSPVLVRFRETVSKIYGDRLERIVLFGSRARGDARPDSDYDIAVFLRDYATVFRNWIGWRISAPISLTPPARL